MLRQGRERSWKIWLELTLRIGAVAPGEGDNQLAQSNAIHRHRPCHERVSLQLGTSGGIAIHHVGVLVVLRIPLAQPSQHALGYTGEQVSDAVDAVVTNKTTVIYVDTANTKGASGNNFELATETAAEKYFIKNVAYAYTTVGGENRLDVVFVDVANNLDSNASAKAVTITGIAASAIANGEADLNGASKTVADVSTDGLVVIVADSTGAVKASGALADNDVITAVAEDGSTVSYVVKNSGAVQQPTTYTVTVPANAVAATGDNTGSDYTVTADVTSAASGATVTITVKVKTAVTTGTDTLTLTATDADSGSVTVTNGTGTVDNTKTANETVLTATFTMPAKNVTVSLTAVNAN